MSEVWRFYKWKINDQTEENGWNEHTTRAELLDIMRNSESQFQVSARIINGDDKLSAEEKTQKIQKKWQEFLASLQLLLLSKENLIVKFADKIHNLTDIEYTKKESKKDPELMERKKISILKTTEIYEFLLEFYQLGNWKIPFETAKNKSLTAGVLDATPVVTLPVS